MERLESHVEKREAQLRHWGARLDRCVAKADEFGATAKSDYRRRVEELRSKYQVAQDKFDQLKTASGERWEALRAELEYAWDEFEASLARLSYH